MTTDQQAVQTFRHRTNRLAAPIVQVVLVGLWILGDPLALRGGLPADDALTTLQAVLITAAFGLAGVLAMAFGWYARVEVSLDTVVIRNPLHTIYLHGGIQQVDTDARHVRIKADDHWYRCWGAETSLGMQLWQSRTSSSAKLRQALSPLYRSTSTPPKTSWRKPTVPEIVIAAGWISLTVFSALRGVNT